MDRGKKKGLIYLAFGYEYLLMAAHSASTARESNPGIVCELITNIPFANEKLDGRYRFDKVTLLERDSGENRFVKTSIIHYTDLEYCAYVDCDTEIRGSLDPAFDYLDRFDLAIKLCPKPTRKIYDVAPGVSSLEFPEWNGGVLFFRKNERAEAFFKSWNDIFRKAGKNRDQPALAQAMYHSDWGGRLLSLNAIWNTFRSDVRLLKRGMKDSRIWHYRKAEEWPAVAPSILAAHHALAGAVATQGDTIQSDLRELERRYRFLSLPLYRLACRHPRLRRNVINLMDCLMKMGAVPRFKLLREDRVAGESYRQIGTEASL